MSAIQDIQNKAVEFESLKTEISNLKQIWETQTALIIQARLRNSFKYAAMLEDGEIFRLHTPNNQVIYSFPKTGLAFIKGNAENNLENGSSLVFDLLKNGKIEVLAQRDFNGEAEPLGVYEQFQFDQSYLTEELLAKFLDKLIEWESADW